MFFYIFQAILTSLEEKYLYGGKLRALRLKLWEAAVLVGQKELDSLRENTIISKMIKGEPGNRIV